MVMAAILDSKTLLFEHRLSMFIERGFDMEDALTLCRAMKLISHETKGKLYVYEIPVTWHDVAKLQEAGATNEQILRILG